MTAKKKEGSEQQRRAKARDARRRGRAPSAEAATTGASKQRHHLPVHEDQVTRQLTRVEGKQRAPRISPDAQKSPRTRRWHRDHPHDPHGQEPRDRDTIGKARPGTGQARPSVTPAPIRKENTMAQDIVAVMTTDVATVDADAALIDAARVMHDRYIGDVVVTDEDQVVGVVTDRDLTIRGTARGAEPTATPVRDVMSRELVTLETDQTVDDATAIMRENALRRLVITENGALAGVVSLGDLAVQRDRGSVLGEISAAPPNE
jgi:CBS domain-containing protein